MQFYQNEPHDVGISDIVIPSDQVLETSARRALLGYFNNPTISLNQRPHYVRVITRDNFRAELTLVVTGPQTVERV